MKLQLSSARRWALGVLSGALVLGLASVGTAQARETKDIVQVGDKVCTRCHDDGEIKPILSIGKTRHGTVADGRTPTCTSCHGESPTHVTRPEGVAERPLPDINFKKGTATPAVERDQVCLSCHQGGARMHWDIGAHATRDVACTDCHQMHVQHDPARDRVKQVEVCTDCHTEQRAQINRPTRHPIKEGKVACSDCHNPHGSAGPKLMVRDSVNETCYTCHMEKRGPFVRTHQPVTEDCSICHNPHGTVTDNLLKARAPFLCQQCHEPTSHRGVIASLDFPVSATSNVTLARGCLNCHTNIHGTNNPLNVGNERTFRR